VAHVESSKPGCAQAMLSPVWNFHGPVRGEVASPSTTDSCARAVGGAAASNNKRPRTGRKYRNLRTDAFAHVKDDLILAALYHGEYLAPAAFLWTASETVLSSTQRHKPPLCKSSARRFAQR
jgi:hypothetical protein